MAVRDNLSASDNVKSFVSEDQYGHTFKVPAGAKVMIGEGEYGIYIIDFVSLHATNGSSNVSFDTSGSASRFGGYKTGAYVPNASIRVKGVDSNYKPFTVGHTYKYSFYM